MKDVQLKDAQLKDAQLKDAQFKDRPLRIEGVQHVYHDAEIVEIQLLA